MSSPKVETVREVAVGNLLLYETVNGDDLCHVEVAVRPYFDRAMNGVVMLFYRERFMLDYVIFSLEGNKFPDYMGQEGLDFIKASTISLISRYGKKTNLLRPLATSLVVVLRELGAPKSFISDLINLFPEVLRYKLENPEAKRRKIGPVIADETKTNDTLRNGLAKP
jgi:hypothetical protein